MLTNIYYYEYYRPYIIRNDDNATKAPSFKKNNKFKESSSFENAYSIMLNKSIKKDVLNYARDIYHNVIGVKNTSKNIIRDINDIVNYDENASEKNDDETLEDLLNYLYDDVESFVNNYNNSSKFKNAENNHSDELANFASQIDFVVDNLSGMLKNLGIEQDETGRLSINEDTKNNMSGKSQGELKSIVSDVNSFFAQTYNYSKDVLLSPMKEHMNFKNLKYFYNYKYDKIETDTFMLIESGMLVDVAL